MIDTKKPYEFLNERWKPFISLCITNHNRFQFTIESFEQIIDDCRISEIIISDDKSTDRSFEKLREFFMYHPKVKVFQNEENLGVYKNKKHAIELSKNDWCLIIDSDNIFTTDFIDKLYDLQEWNENTIYTPSFGKPALDYRHFEGIEITKENAGNYIDQKHGGSMFNTMNCMVNKNFYLKVFDDSIEPVAADSIQTNLNYLLNGGKMYIVPNLIYTHTIHSGSHYVNFTHKSDIYHKQITDKIRLMK